MADSSVTKTSVYEGYSGSSKPKGGHKKLLGFLESENIAEELTPEQLNRFGDRVGRDYDIDKASRAEWEEKCNRAMEMATQVAEEKFYPWPKASNVKFPLLTTAAIQFAARAYPAIITGRDLVKAKVQGDDNGVPMQGPDGQQAQDEQGQPQWETPPGAKLSRGERVAHHMSWQLTEEMQDWEEDTDKLLHILPIVGCVFRKTWFDPYQGKNRSELVMAKDLVVNYGAKSLETAPRITHLQRWYPNEIVEQTRMGLWREVELGHSKEGGADEDAPHEFLEQHRALDLDEDGYDEPYIVTVHKDSGQVVRIVARFDREGILVNSDGEVARIEPVHYFVKYPFIPNPDGGFYDIGFGTLLGPIGEAVNTTLNLMIDAGHLQNTGGGFIGKGLRLKSGPTRLRPGEWKPVDVTGSNVKDNVVPLPFPGPSVVLFSLLGLLIEAGRDISSVKDVMTGDAGNQQEAATRTLARIEQGMKVFTAIYKRVYRSWKKELKLLFRLNRVFLNPDTYFTLLDEAEAVSPTDYNPNDLDIVPVADASVITDMQRLARAEFLMGFLADPYVDPINIRERIFTAANTPDIDKLLIQGAPPTDPKVAEAADKMDIEKRRIAIESTKSAGEMEIGQARATAEIAETESKTVLNLAKAEGVEPGQQLEQYKAQANALQAEAKADIDRTKAEQQAKAAEAKAAEAPPAGPPQ